MKTLSPIHNYASEIFEFHLRDEANQIISVGLGCSVFLVGKRSLTSETQLFKVLGEVIDSTTGHVRFNIKYTDTTHEAGNLFYEIRVSGSGVDRVAGQFEGSFADSLSRSNFYTSDFSTKYDTHIMLSEDALEGVSDQSLLDEYDLIIVDHESFGDLDTNYSSKTIVRFDFMSSRYLTKPEGLPYTGHLPGPADQGMATVQNDEGRYLYTIDGIWRIVFLANVLIFLSGYGNRVKGIMLDNFYPDMGVQWLLEDGDDLTVWPDRTDGAGDLVPDWNQSLLELVENDTRIALDAYIPGGILIVGGTVRALSATRRFAENVSLTGPATHVELFSKLVDDGVTYPNYYAQSGDLLQINCYDSTGAFGLWTDNSYGSGGQNFADASYLSVDRGCSLGVAFGESPLSGKSIYSLLVDPKSPRWLHY